MFDYRQNYIKRWLSCFVAVLTLCSLYCFFIPISTIQDNQRFLNATTTLVWVKLLLFTLGTTIIISSILALLRKKAGIIIISLIAGIVFASFIQMLFFNSQLGVLDGSYPIWGSDIKKIVINGIIWILLITIPVVISICNEKIHSLVVTVIFLAVLISQVVSVGSTALFGNTESMNDTSYVLNGKDQYTVSEKNNILVFSFDRLSKDYFEMILEEDQEIKEGLKDFTYYSNTCGTYTTTFPSLVGLLTGTQYLGDVPYRNYFSDSWNSKFTNTFYPTFRNNGYKINFFINEYLYMESSDLLGKADNLILAQKEIRDVFYPRILRVSFYRLLPFCLKQYALISRLGTVMTAEFLNKAVKFTPVSDSNTSYSPIRKDMSYLDDFLNEGIKKDTENNIFSWTHLQGAHSPHYTDARGKFVFESSAVEQGKGYIYAVEQFFNEMKKIDVYDDAIIILTADHGTDQDSAEDFSMFVPLVIKLPGETHDTIIENTAPLSLNDLSPTLLSLVCEEKNDFGKTVFEYTEQEIRERIQRQLRLLPKYETEEWTDGSNGTFNAMVTYRFTGDQDTLNHKVRTGDYTEIPLVDSFY